MVSSIAAAYLILVFGGSSEIVLPMQSYEACKRELQIIDKARRQRGSQNWLSLKDIHCIKTK